MIRSGEVFKAVKQSLPGVRFEELAANAADVGYSVLCDINGTWFKAFLPAERVSRCYGDEKALVDLIASPFTSLRKLYHDGIAEGRERERKEEMRQLRAKHEDAYRRLRHGAMAAAYRAVVASMGASNAT